MRNKLKTLLLFLALLVVSMTVSVLMYHAFMVHEPEHVTIRADTVVHFDTIYIEKPVAKDCIVTRYVTRYLPVIKTEVDTSGTVVKEIVSHSNGGIGYSKSLDEEKDEPPNKDYALVAVSVPITQKTYEAEEYTAWVSGYEAALDSIKLYQRSQYVEREIFITKKRRRWVCVAGAGIGTDTRTIIPTIGLTFGYVIF